MKKKSATNYPLWPKVGHFTFLADFFRKKKSATMGTTPVGFFREALSLLNLEILYDSVFCSKVMVEERCVKSDKAQWWFAGSLSTLIYTLKDSILQESWPLTCKNLSLNLSFKLT